MAVHVQQTETSQESSLSWNFETQRSGVHGSPHSAGILESWPQRIKCDIWLWSQSLDALWKLHLVEFVDWVLILVPMLKAVPEIRGREAGWKNQLAEEKPQEVRQEVSMHTQNDSEKWGGKCNTQDVQYSSELKIAWFKHFKKDTNLKISLELPIWAADTTCKLGCSKPWEATAPEFSKKEAANNWHCSSCCIKIHRTHYWLETQ